MLCQHLHNLLGDINQNNEREELPSNGKRRPHSYLLNEKAKDSESETEVNSEKHRNETSFNGALNQIEGKNTTSIFFDKP